MVKTVTGIYSSDDYAIWAPATQHYHQNNGLLTGLYGYLNNTVYDATGTQLNKSENVIIIYMPKTIL